MRILVAFFQGGSGRARISVWWVHSCIPVVSRVFLGSAVGLSPHSGLDIPLFSSSSSSLSSSRLFLDFYSRLGTIYSNICIFSFLSFRHSLEGIEGMCVRLSSSLSPDLSLICASFDLPLLATAFPRARYIPVSLWRVMLLMESIDC